MTAREAEKSVLLQENSTGGERMLVGGQDVTSAVSFSVLLLHFDTLLRSVSTAYGTLTLPAKTLLQHYGQNLILMSTRSWTAQSFK